MLYEALRCKQPVAVPGFCCSDCAVLREFGEQQICHGLQASMAADTQTSKACRIKDLVKLSFRYRMAPMTLENGGRLLQLFSDTNRRRTETPLFNMATASSFDVILFFQCFSLFNVGYRMKCWQCLKTTALVRWYVCMCSTFSRPKKAFYQVTVCGCSQSDGCVHDTWQQRLSLPGASDAFWGSFVVISAATASRWWQWAQRVRKM